MRSGIKNRLTPYSAPTSGLFFRAHKMRHENHKNNRTATLIVILILILVAHYFGGQ